MGSCSREVKCISLNVSRAALVDLFMAQAAHSGSYHRYLATYIRSAFSLSAHETSRLIASQQSNLNPVVTYVARSLDSLVYDIQAIRPLQLLTPSLASPPSAISTIAIVQFVIDVTVNYHFG